jgi:phosphoribosyl-dephospho-CoA transferase
MSVNTEISQLKEKLAKLEKQKIKELELHEKTSASHNLNILNIMLEQKKKAININRYSKSVPLARFYDQELVTHLDATYNLLQIINNK